MDLFSDETRRDPWRICEQLRAAGPVLRVPPSFDAWVISRCDDVKRALTDHETFSSRVPAPQWTATRTGGSSFVNRTW
jgi:cytochrome P450